MEEDRRIHSRFSASYRVTVNSSRGVMEGLTRNMGPGGACICCQELLNPQEKLHLVIEVPYGAPLELPAEVVWTRASDLDREPSWQYAGVRFEF